MADISITDQASLTASVKVSDDSPLALANLKNLNFRSLPVVSNFPKPIDQFPLDEVELGVGLSTPATLTGNNAQLCLSGGTSASLSVSTPKSKELFGDQFSPEIKINQGECWAGLCIDFSLKESVATPSTGFGVCAAAKESISLATYLRLPTTAGFPLPSFKDGLVSLLQAYSIPSTPEEVRKTPIGIVHTAETSGSISLGASYSAPLTINPLATLAGPLNLSLSVAPAIDACVKGVIELEGSFIVRSYRSSETKLVVGVYKKRETELTASLSATAGIGIDLETTDILAKVLDAVVPGADLNDLRLDDSQKDELRKALRECVDQSISIALNACCTASVSDEAAVVYELDLSASDMTQTDKAIASALRGDWSQFETLSSATRLRNIVRDLHERNHKLTLNLLGLYNAISISDYLKSTTVLHDEHGQISVVDKVSAKNLSAGTTPYAAKADKLRAALAQAFIATVAYGAAKGKLGITSFTVQQSFLEYHAKASASDLTPQVLLARAVKLSLSDAWDSILKSKGVFNQNKFYLNTGYDAQSVLRLFYQNVANRTPYPSEAIDRIGRDTKVALLDPIAQNSMQRRTALGSDDIWNAMTASGDVAAFRFIPGLARLNAPALAAVSADFLDIRWWSDALKKVTPKLTAVLNAIDESKSTNPLTETAFMVAHKALEDALFGLSSQTHSAFGDGWPIAVMYRLAVSANAAAPSVQMDIGWNGKFEHYETGAPIAVGKGNSG